MTRWLPSGRGRGSASPWSCLAPYCPGVDAGAPSSSTRWWRVAVTPGHRLASVARGPQHGTGHIEACAAPARLHVIPDAVVMPGSGVVCTRDGRVVAESVTSPMIGRVPPDGGRANPPLDLDGTVAVFRSPLRPTTTRWSTTFPGGWWPILRSGGLGPITLLHGGALRSWEATLLGSLDFGSDPGGRTRSAGPGGPGRHPQLVTRPGAVLCRVGIADGAIAYPCPKTSDAPRRGTSWLRPTPTCPTERSCSRSRPHGIADPGPSGGSVAERLAVMRWGDDRRSGRDALAVALISRSAHVVELPQDPPTLDPSMYHCGVQGPAPTTTSRWPRTPDGSRCPIGGVRRPSTGFSTGWLPEPAREQDPRRAAPIVGNPGGSDRSVGDEVAQRQQLLGGPAELQLQLPGLQEAPVQRVVAVHAHAAVEVLGCVHDPLTTPGGPELGGDPAVAGWSLPRRHSAWCVVSRTASVSM